jgi:hypothetical protein
MTLVSPDRPDREAGQSDRDARYRGSRRIEPEPDGSDQLLLENAVDFMRNGPDRLDDM